MTLKTVPVTGILYNPDGSVAANAVVVAQLTTVDTDGGVIVPGSVSTTTDAGGVFTLMLWPNSRGVNGTQYLLRGQMPGALPGVLLMNLKITVPDSDPSVPVPVSTITNRTLPSALSDAKAAMLGAQAAVVQAQQVLASAIAVAGALPNVSTVAAALPNINLLAANISSINGATSTQLKAWAAAQAFTVSSATRDANEAITTASIVWPDGTPGTYTADTLSITFPGATDAWHATYVGASTRTITQPAVTRDSNGAVTAQPAITIV